MDIGWRLLRLLPKTELARLSDDQITRYLQSSATELSYMRRLIPTRSTALDLADQLPPMRQGYEFLDEKRMLLAM